MRDCYFIVADANMEQMVRGMLQRPPFELTLGVGSSYSTHRTHR